MSSFSRYRKLASRPFIVALTSFVDENVDQQCKSKGFDLVFEAPLTKSKADKIVLQFKQRNKQLMELHRRIIKS